jgi:hypothetical protein
MAKSGMHEVASELLRLSKANKLSWEQYIRDNEYKVHFPDVTFQISCDEYRRVFQLELIGDTGQVNGTLEWQPEDVNAGQDPGLREIFDLAEAYVRDGTINKALQYLKQA